MATESERASFDSIQAAFQDPQWLSHWDRTRRVYFDIDASQEGGHGAMDVYAVRTDQSLRGRPLTGLPRRSSVLRKDGEEVRGAPSKAAHARTGPYVQHTHTPRRVSGRRSTPSKRGRPLTGLPRRSSVLRKDGEEVREVNLWKGSCINSVVRLHPSGVPGSAVAVA
jgi:hypothetical protein